MKCRSTISLLFFFASALLFARSVAAEECAEKFQKIGFGQYISSDMKKHWLAQIQPLKDLSAGKISSTIANQRIASKLPKPLLNALELSKGCGLVAACLAKQGIKTSYAPITLMWNSLEAPINAMLIPKAALSRNPLLRVAQRSAFVPIQLLYKGAPYVVGYTALTLNGMNVPAELISRSTTYMEDIKAAVPKRKAFNKNELFVLIKGSGPSDDLVNSTRYALIEDDIYQGTLKQEQVVTLTVSSKEDLLNQLGKLRAQGQIRELAILAHGEKAAFDFQDPGVEGLFHPSRLLADLLGNGSVIESSLPSLKAGFHRLPKDLFVDDARIDLISCSVAEGKGGKAFVRDLATIMLPRGGTFVASTRTLMGSSVSRQDLLDLANPKLEGSTEDALTYHFQMMPLMELLEGPSAHILDPGAYGENQTTEVVRVPKK